MNKEDTLFDGFRKRDGIVVPFHRGKIESAVRRAAEEVARRDHQPVALGMPERIAERVIGQLNDPASVYYVRPDEHGQRIPVIEDVQDVVEIVLAEEGFTSVVAAYKLYRKQREVARKTIRVRAAAKGLAAGSSSPSPTPSRKSSRTCFMASPPGAARCTTRSPPAA